MADAATASEDPSGPGGSEDKGTTDGGMFFHALLSMCAIKQTTYLARGSVQELAFSRE